MSAGHSSVSSSAPPLPATPLSHWAAVCACTAPAWQAERAARHRVELNLAGYLQIVDAPEGLADIRTAGEQAVVAQDHDAAFAQVDDQAVLLVRVERDALIIVIGDAVEELEAVLLHRDQPFLEAGDRDAGAGVGVDHSVEVRPRPVDAGVDDVARRVDPRAGIVDRRAVQVDLDQARGVISE